MENRITRFLFPILLGLAAFMLLRSVFAPKEGEVRRQEESGEVSLEIDPSKAPAVVNPASWERFPSSFPETVPPDLVGRPGMLVQFDSLGGGVRSVRLTDFYEHPGTEPGEDLPTRELYEAVRAEEEGLYSFVIEDFKGSYLVKNPKRPGSRWGVPLQELHWRRVGDLEGRGARFRLELDNGLVFERDFAHDPESRELRLTLRILNRSKALAGEVFSYKLRGAATMATDPPGASFVNPPQAFAAWTERGELEISHVPGDKKPNPPDLPDLMRVNLGGQSFAYAGSTNRFFTCILFPADPGTRRAVRAVEAFKLPFRKTIHAEAYQNIAPLLLIEQEIPDPESDGRPGRSELSFRIYIGPKDRDLFDAVEDYRPFLAAADLDYQISCFCAPGASSIGKVLLSILKFFHGLFGNWGLSIIVLTILVRAALSPLNYRQMKAMGLYQKRMAKFKPQLDALKKKYEKDPKRLNQELMKFNKEHKLFPPLMGCLPMFLTMPVFFGLFTMLRASFELRHEPFLGWIEDLSQPDRLFHIGDSGFFLIPEYFNLLPVLMMIFWVLNSFGQKLPDDPQQRQTQQMMRFMPLIFGIMLYNYASGLALYMVVSSVWSLCEQKLLKKRLGLGTGGMTPTF